MASFTQVFAVKLRLPLCGGLLCVIFSVFTSTSSLPRAVLRVNQLEEVFQERKAYWLANDCIFPAKSSFEAPDIFDSSASTFFPLKACSSADEMPENATIGLRLCALLFSVSENLCHENLQPSVLAQLTENEAWDMCSDAATKLVAKNDFAFLNDTEQCKKQCIENTKISPVCRLVVAAALKYEEARRAGVSTSHPQTQDTDRRPTSSEGMTTSSVPLPKDSQTTSQPAEEQKTSLMQQSWSITASTGQKTSPQANQTTTVPLGGQKTSPQGNQTTTASLGGQKTSPQGNQTTTVPLGGQKTSPQGNQTTTAPLGGQKTSPQGNQTTTASLGGQKTSPQGNQTTTAPLGGQKTSPQGNQTTASPQGTEKTSQPTGGSLNNQENTGDGDKDLDKEHQPSQPENPEASGQPAIPGDGVQVVNKLDFGEESHSSGKFMIYFIAVVVLCVAGYVIYHNRRKVIAFIMEGRQSDKQRRSPSSNGSNVKYSKLKPSAEELLPSLDKPVSATNYIY